MIESLHELTLGGVPIDGLAAEMLTEGGYRFSVAADGLEFGSSEAVESVVRALAADGSSARIDGHDNADTTFRLLIEGEDYTALNRGEAAFRRLLPDGYSGSVDLLWRPPDGHAPASVRTVLKGTFVQDFDDMTELQLAREYVVTLTHLPFVRSEFPSVASAAAIGAGSLTVIDECSSASGWTASGTSGVPIAPTASGGALHFPLEPSEGLRAWSIGRPGDVDLTATPYLVVEVKFPPQTLGDDAALVSGATWLRPMQVSVTTEGYRRYMFDTSGGWTPQPLRFHFGQAAGGDWVRTLSIRHIEALPTPNPTLPKQSSRLLSVGGTERTPGTLHVFSRDMTPLGLTIVHTSPDEGTGYDPDFSRWVTNNAGTPGADAPNGRWRSIQSPSVIEALVPSASLPTGTYQIGAWVKSSTAQRVGINWIAGTVPRPSAGTVASYDNGLAWVDLQANVPAFVGVGSTTLPTSIAGAGRTYVFLTQVGSGPAVMVGGMWLFRTGQDCGLTAVNSQETHLWVVGEEAGSVGHVVVGSQADMSDAYTPSVPYGEIVAASPHTFRAGTSGVYVISTVPHAGVEVEHYRRWPFNAADDGTGEPT